MERRRLSTALRIVGIVGAVALALLLAVRLQARSADAKLESEFVRVVGPLDPEAYASVAVLDAENAAIWLRGAGAAVNLSRADKDLIGDLGRLPAEQWTAEQDAAIERVFARNAPALLLAGRAASLARSSYGLSGREATDSKYPMSLLEMMWLARTIDLQGRFAVTKGDWAAFRLAASELACLASSLESESPLIGQLVGVATEAMAFDVVRAGVESPAAGREALQGLDAAIPSLDLVRAWRRAIGALATGVRTGVVHPDDMFDRDATNVEITVPSGDDYLRIALEVEGLAASPIGLDAALADRLQKSKGMRSGRSVADHLAGALVRYQSRLSLRRLARIAIALRLAAIEEGRYPDSLARWPEAAAPDPFTGGTMAYERRPDGSAVLAVPGAEELFDRVNEIRSPVPYDLVLPARGPAAAGTHH